ncbi:MAG: AAA family ATPase [Cocleimonas sp.]
MLINSLLAENFRKYNKLEVTEIPEKGAITVSGANESGKTSIGEAICFALFGRTFSLDKKNLAKLVGWGKDLAEVTLEFTVEKEKKFRLYRSVDSNGVIQAKLTKVLLSGMDDPKVIDNIVVVDKVLSKVIGFDYDAFANSFYLVQRELTTPEPQSETIKKMAGIGDYASFSNELLIINDENEEKITEAKPKIIATQASLDEINLDETWLPDLVDADQTLDSEQQQRQTLLNSLHESEQNYAEKSVSYHGARKKRGFFSFLSWLFFPAMLVSLGVWVTNKVRPELLENPLINIFGLDELATKQDQIGTWLLPVAVITGLGFLISLLVKGKSATTMHDLDNEAKDFSKTLQEGHGTVSTDIGTVLPGRVVELMQNNSNTSVVTEAMTSKVAEKAVKEKVSSENTNTSDIITNELNETADVDSAGHETVATLLAMPPSEQFKNIETLAEGTVGYKANPEDINAAVGRLSDTFNKQKDEIKQLSSNLSGDIAKEKTRSDTAGKLRSSIKILTGVVDSCGRIIKVNNTSIGLMQRASEDSINLFNKNITKLSAKTLPKFTEGRYNEVRVAEDFSVQVYSDEKKGYMDFDEISSGTQRQIMLALRLAMSEELAKNTGNEQQFIFLDEPFAFFDPQRTRSTLNALPDVSDVITQVWIVAQEFPEDIEVAKVIKCPSDSAELSV